MHPRKTATARNELPPSSGLSRQCCRAPTHDRGEQLSPVPAQKDKGLDRFLYSFSPLFFDRDRHDRTRAVASTPLCNRVALSSPAHCLCPVTSSPPAFITCLPQVQPFIPCIHFQLSHPSNLTTQLPVKSRLLKITSQGKRKI